VLRLYVICVALTVGCRDSELVKLEKTRDEVCECKSVKCAEAALDHVPKSNVEPSPRAQRIAREMLDCLAALYDQDRPTQDPDAPSEPEPTDPASARRP
jgi:hypothetical protein